MAKKSTPLTTDSTFARAPKGFRQLGSVTAECWFALKPGNVIQGKLLGVYKRKDTRVKSGESEFFQVVLSEPCECRYGRGEKVTFKTAPAGTTANLNCNTKTEVLKDSHGRHGSRGAVRHPRGRATRRSRSRTATRCGT